MQILHRVTKVNAVNKTGICSVCGDVKVKYIKHRDLYRCMTKVKEENDRWRNKEESKQKVRTYKAIKHGMDITCYKDTFDLFIVLQDGLCAICEKQLGVGTRPCLDHDHKTGEVRGVLCNACNRGLGLLEDNLTALKNAVKYLS